MGFRLEKPPLKEPLVDARGMLTPVWQRYFQRQYFKTGGESLALPVSLGGSGVTNVAAAVAVTAAASTVAGAANQPQNITVTLNRPSSDALGDSATTEATWTTPFSDNNYTPTVAFVGIFGQLSIEAQTAAGLTLRLTNNEDGNRARGSAECTGVHA
jgi:hypothetical protein